MTTEVKIHITEDDLSESIRQKIKAFRKQGIEVQLVWPSNSCYDIYYDIEHWFKPTQSQPVITPLQTSNSSDDPWEITWIGAPDIHCK